MENDIHEHIENLRSIIERGKASMRIPKYYLLKIPSAIRCKKWKIIYGKSLAEYHKWAENWLKKHNIKYKKI